VTRPGRALARREPAGVPSSKTEPAERRRRIASLKASMTLARSSKVQFRARSSGGMVRGSLSRFLAGLAALTAILAGSRNRPGVTPPRRLKWGYESQWILLANSLGRAIGPTPGKVGNPAKGNPRLSTSRLNSPTVLGPYQAPSTRNGGELIPSESW
jgi:hypothetical protein